VSAALAAARPALAAYAGIRLVGLLALYLSTGSVSAARHFLTRWDGAWYAGIAEDGYGFTRLHQGRLLSDYVFFPLYPGLERLTTEVTGLSLVDAGLLVSWVASLLAAWGIFAVGDRLHGPRVGTLLVAIWAALPMSVVLSMAYTESLFTALSAWCLYAVLRGRWLTAGVLASLAGLTRPVGLAVALAVIVPAVIAVLRPAAGEGGGRRTAGALWWPVAGAAMAPLGWAGYVGWVGLQTGSIFGYSEAADRWGNGFDGGVAFAHWAWGLISRPGSPVGPLVALGLVGLAWLCVTCVRQRQPLPLLVYCAVLVLLAVTTSGYFGSRPRYLLPAFPLLLPLARGAARLPRRVAVPLLGLVVVASAVYGALWLQGPAPP
jgi:hypothetical protein